MPEEIPNTLLKSAEPRDQIITFRVSESEKKLIESIAGKDRGATADFIRESVGINIDIKRKAKK